MDPYPSSTLSLVLSWLFGFLPLLYFLVFLNGNILPPNFNEDRFIEEQPWLKGLLILWGLVCLVVYSPALYLVFMSVLFASYAAQGIGAFFIGISVLAALVPLLILVYSLIGIVAPFWVAIRIAGLKLYEPMKLWRVALGAVLLPVLCKIGFSVFFALLPVLRPATGWLDGDNLIRATNGPAGLIYRYAAAPIAPILRPDFNRPELQTPINEVRANVAAHFLSPEQQLVFVKKQFPDDYMLWVGEPN
jgi:hypothetical protein